MYDEDNFFKQATLSICSSLEVEKSLSRCLSFLQHYMPGDEMLFNVFDPEQGSLRILAQAIGSEGKKINEFIFLPADVRDYIIKNYFSASNSEHLFPKSKVVVINKPEDYKVYKLARLVRSSVKLSHASIIAMPLFLEGQQLGVVDLLAKGYERFNADHCRLFAMLHEPFAIALANALRHQELSETKERVVEENRHLQQELQLHSNKGVIGLHTGLKEVMERIRQVAPLDNTILLLGETGVGKDLIAQTIHNLSSRKQGPFIRVNCGAIPENLLESELFGHEKGAFTGAISRKIGKFEQANQGTIFLDEIAEFSPQAQVSLLHILQGEEIERIGGSKPINSNCRIIAATHRDLYSLVETGRFREDLWFRINVFPVKIPSLSDRREDIPQLVHQIIKDKCHKFGLSVPARIDPRCIDRLMDYDWPGNIRELENILERVLIQNQGQNIKADDFRFCLEDRSPGKKYPDKQKIMGLDQKMREHIQMALELCHGKVHGPNGAARLLDIHPSTLRHRIKKLGI